MSQGNSFRAPAENLDAADEFLRFIPKHPELWPMLDSVTRPAMELYNERLPDLLDDDEHEFELHATGGRRVGAWRLSVMWRALQAHAECEHEPPYLVSLASMQRVCQRCVEHLRDVPDNGCCDVCGKPATAFRPFVVTVGPFIVHGDECDTCMTYSAGKAIGYG
jgi:hypothetical protein